jgi:hypothetical protein
MLFLCRWEMINGISQKYILNLLITSQYKQRTFVEDFHLLFD